MQNAKAVLHLEADTMTLTLCRCDICYAVVAEQDMWFHSEWHSEQYELTH